MSLHSRDISEVSSLTRRSWLRRAGGAAATMIVSPLLVRAECPCPDDLQNAKPRLAADVIDEKVKTAAAAPIKSLRVCADPNNLPYSNRDRAGFEDKIAKIIADDLQLPLEYDWLPQRLGFYRTALKNFDSNLVMAAPAGFDKALVSDPYYRSTYVFVQRNDAKSKVKSLDDDALRTLKIGVQLTGGDNTPPTHSLIKRKLIDNVEGYPAFDESAGKPGENIIMAVASGEIDVALAWGPSAGYFAKRQTVALDVTPVAPEVDKIGDVKMPFTFAICMALRRPDKELRSRINDVIKKHQSEIQRILKEYGVPLLPLSKDDTGTAFGSTEEGKSKSHK